MPVGESLERFCAAAQAWDAKTGAGEGEGTAAWYVLGCVLDRPEWRALVEAELQDIPTQATMCSCLIALIARGSLDERELITSLVRAVDAQLEALSEDHAKVLRRRRRWLAAELHRPDTDHATTASLAASLAAQTVWEEMRRHRSNLTAWRELTADLLK